MVKKWCSFILMFTLFFSNAKAEVIYDSESWKSFQNLNCQKSESCSLKKINIRVRNFRVYMNGVKGPNFGTSIASFYQTDQVQDLKEYAVVQFIKGCSFYSKIINGKISYQFVRRQFFNKIIPFQHRELVIDSIDLDPMYQSADSTQRSRHSFYKWNRLGLSTHWKTRVFFGDEVPLDPMLYVEDHPSQAFFNYEINEAKNVSLKFFTCIYKTKDIPLELVPNNIDFAKPLKCFSWSSSYVYDHKKEKFNSPEEISEICSKE